jgi:hypothetical protein
MLSRWLLYYWLQTCIKYTFWSKCCCSLFKQFCYSFLILTHPCNPYRAGPDGLFETKHDHWVLKIVHHEKLVNASVKFWLFWVSFCFYCDLFVARNKANSYVDNPELSNWLLRLLCYHINHYMQGYCVFLPSITGQSLSYYCVMLTALWMKLYPTFTSLCLRCFILLVSIVIEIE